MGKASKKKSPSGNEDKGDDEINHILPTLKIAQAVMSNDANTLSSVLESSLPGSPRVQNVTIEKSLGESFTGGRSTPVYFVRCQVLRSSLSKQRSFVVKLVWMPGKDSAVQQKRQSYAVERRFYEETSERIRDRGLSIPKLLASDLDGTKPYPAFCILMNDVSQKFAEHPTFMSVQQAKCALAWVARLHALFYRDPLQATWRRDLWSRGAFWTKTHKVDGISAAWVGTIKYLEQKHPEYVTDGTKSLGQRIQLAGSAISDYLSKQTTVHGTLIHGDYKAANLFFSETLNGSDSVAVVDFQYTGLGLGAEDVAYMLYPDARGDFFQHEELLLQTYYESLVEQLMLNQKGGPSSLPFSEFKAHYNMARLDMTRHWIAKGWRASTAGEAKLVSLLETTMHQIDGGMVLKGVQDYQARISKLTESMSL